MREAARSLEAPGSFGKKVTAARILGLAFSGPRQSGSLRHSLEVFRFQCLKSCGLRIECTSVAGFHGLLAFASPGLGLGF